jgi:hypothetical protein
MTPVTAAGDASIPACRDAPVRPGPAGPGTGPDPDKIMVMALRVWSHKQG